MATSIVTIICVVVIILVSMILHELAHGVMAYALGDDTAKQEGRLTLNLFKHLDPFLSLILPLFLLFTGGPIFGGAKPVPVNSRNLKYGVWGMALVAIAGPQTNFLLAFLAFLIGFWTGGLMDTGAVGYCFTEFILVNLGFCIFNLIPIPPLDGSRVLYAIAPDAVRSVMDRMETFGIMIVMLIVVFVPSLVSVIIGGGMTGILNFFYLIVGA